MAYNNQQQQQHMKSEADQKSKLIVNYLPQALSDVEFEVMFTKVADPCQTKVMRDRATNYSFGYGFVEYSCLEHCHRAIEMYNGFKIGIKTLKVAFSKPKSDKNTNLYITGLGPNTSEEQIKQIFEKHGEVVNVKILREKLSGTSKQSGFVLFDNKESADKAIRSLQNYADGRGMDLVIKYAKESADHQMGHPAFQKYLQTKAMQAGYGGGMGGGYTDFQQDYNAYANQMRSGLGNQMDSGYENQMMDAGSAAYGGGYAGATGGVQRAMRGRGQAARFNPMQRRPAGMAGMGGVPGQMGGMSQMQGMAGGHMGMAGGQMGMAGAGQMGGQADMMQAERHTVFVYNIGPNTAEIEMHRLFGKYGAIMGIDMSDAKGFCFVHFAKRESAAEAIMCTNKTMFPVVTPQGPSQKELQVSFHKKGS